MKLFQSKPVRWKNPLTEELTDAGRALEIAYSRFENAVDPDLIDCSIYEVNSILERYKYLLKLAKAAQGSAAQGSAAQGNTAQGNAARGNTAKDGTFREDLEAASEVSASRMS